MLFSFLRQIIIRQALSLSYGVGRSILQTAGALVIMLCFITPASAQQRIVALGDSLSAGYLLPQKNAFPTVLERVLREQGVKTGRISALDLPTQIAQAQTLGLLTETQAQWLLDYHSRVMHLINVDDFAPHELGAAPANTGVPT